MLNLEIILTNLLKLEDPILCHLSERRESRIVELEIFKELTPTFQSVNRLIVELGPGLKS